MIHGETHVQWKFKNWEKFTDSDKRELGKHLLDMDKDKAADYIKYLGDFCGAPMESLYGHLKKNLTRGEEFK